EEGHVDHLVRKAIATGAPVSAAYRAATWSAARGFGLRDRGFVAPGYLADLVLLSDLHDVRVAKVLRRGHLVGDELLARSTPVPPVGRGSIRLDRVTEEVFSTPATSSAPPVIGVIAGSIVTDSLALDLPRRNGHRVADPARGVHKVAV